MFAWFLNNPSGILVECLIAFLVIRWFRVPVDRRKTELIFLAAVAAHPVALLIQNVLAFLERTVPIKYDFYVDRFDAFFGQPSFLVGQFFAAHHLAIWGTFIYNLPFILTVGLVALYLWTGRDAGEIVRASVLLWVLLIPLYLIFPVSGPKYAFSGFPFVIPGVQAHAAMIPGAPNGVPSGHMAFALILLYLVRHWKWLIVPGILFVIATSLTALGSGEHYLFDLVVAVPFSALVVWISEFPQGVHEGGATERVQLAWASQNGRWESPQLQEK